MTYIAQIVEHINASVKTGMVKRIPAKECGLFGLAGLVKKSDEDKPQTFPAAYTGNGEVKYLGIDDKFDLQLYHRILNIGVGFDAKNRGYGHNQPDTKNTVKMSMVVFAKREVLQMGSDELFFLLQGLIPEKLNKDQLEALQLKTTYININEVILNEEQVFNEEYKGVAYFIEPEHILMKVNYSIESTFTKGCFNNPSC